jgi:outer membrane usher protein
VDDLPADPQGWVALENVSGLSFEYEAAAQRLQLTVLASRRNLNVIRRVPQARDGDSAAGFLVNYDGLAEELSGSGAVRAYTEARAYGDWGVASNRGTLSFVGGSEEYLRLETLWTRSDPFTLRTVSAGDLISRSLSWSRSVRLGGLQLRRNFALRPDLVTYPVTGFSGEVAVPSTVDLYVNQVRQLTGSLPPGPFQIETPPSVNGAGQATLVVRDELGRETVQTLDLYVVPQLLAEGLHDYSFEAGVLRENYGSESNDYRGGTVGSASLRYGLSDRVTVESHAEGASGLAQLGAGLLLQAGGWGRLSASASLSDSDGGGTGSRYGLGYQYVAPRFNLTLEWQTADGGFRDLPSLLGDAPPRRIARVFSGLQLSPRLHLVASWLETEGRGIDEHSRVASLGLRVNAGRHASLYLNAFRDYEQEDGDGIYAGYSVAIGRSGQLHSEYSSDDDRMGVTLSSRSPHVEGWDWTLRGSHADDSLFQASTRFTGGRGAVGLDYAEDAGEERIQAGVRGAFVFAGRHAIAGRYVQDEFALVSTNGLPGVPVLHENRPAGHTDGAGFLLIENVNAYQPNRLAIDPLAIPFGYTLDSTDRTATPRVSAGTVVQFPIGRPRSAVLVLVDVEGRPLPVGSQGEVVGGGTFVVGYDGVGYLTGLADVNQVRVRTAEGFCVAEFALDATAATQAEVGRVSCQ